MTLQPLLAAGPVVAAHATAAFAALGLGIAQFVRRKGTPSHRAIGWTWVVLMAGVAVSSFGIHGMRQFGSFSLIRVLSAMTLAFLVSAVVHARAGRIDAHRWTMIGLFAGALVITGLFTLWLGRVMHDVVFGR